MYENLKQAVNKANKIVFFTGAGLSTASGIPDFRSATGLYKNCYRAEEMLSHSFFEADPKQFYEFYREKMLYPSALPNYAHEFMAKLERYKQVSIVTQNIDGLHQKAGSKNVYELHGSIHRNYCTNCHKFFSLQDILNQEGIPHCDKCGAIIKPDVVLYEEALDEQTIISAVNVISQADLMVVCGTSLAVYPAASFVNYFKGESLAIINKDVTPYDRYCDIIIHDDLVSTFKALKL